MLVSRSSRLEQESDTTVEASISLERWLSNGLCKIAFNTRVEETFNLARLPVYH